LHDRIGTDFLLFTEGLAETFVEEDVDGQLVRHLVEIATGRVDGRFDAVADAELQTFHVAAGVDGRGASRSLNARVDARPGRRIFEHFVEEAHHGHAVAP
jgi:hypothetical protein